ncbi:MAG: HNH endonuclease [Rhodospirillaceae bacterium]|nr:HNH endonuclease [Rhodospirillaceae bacterium]
MIDLRADQNLEKLHSLYVYSYADFIYRCVQGANGFDDDEIFVDYLSEPLKVVKPQKVTLLHEFIANVTRFEVTYLVDKFPEDSVESTKEILREANIPAPKWLKSTRMRERLDEVCELLEEAVATFTPSIFFVLFSDRQFLTLFQGRIAAFVGTLTTDNHPALIMRNGVLKRPNNLPVWLKAAIFHRDRGRCQHCWKDMTGLGRPITDLHLDHIVPLAASGSNDPTNFQLACERCNKRKGAREINQPSKFTPYW